MIGRFTFFFLGAFLKQNKLQSGPEFMLKIADSQKCRCRQGFQRLTKQTFMENGKPND